MRRRNPPHASQEKESNMRIVIIGASGNIGSRIQAEAAGRGHEIIAFGGDQLLVDANERSHISYEDFAAAILDEIEEPRHIQRRLTVDY
jgi:putative NADH-flavin reductase